MTDKPNPSSLPDQLAAAAGMPTGSSDSSLRPDPAGHGDPRPAPGEAAGDFTLRPDPRGLHDPLPPGAAINLALARLAKVGGEAGLIVIDADGRMDWGHNSPQFAVAHARSGQPARAFIERAQDAPGEPA